jgi:hypothetical protein
MKTTLRYVLAFLSLVLGSGLVVMGCGGASVSDICELICTCNPCTDADRKECESEGEAAKKEAESAGCGSAFGDALTCFHDHASCNDENAASDACSSRFDALEACVEGGGIFNVGDDCTRASDYLAECLNVSTSGSSSATVACEGQTLCAAQCINAADCAAIKDAFSGVPTSASKSFLDCTTTCSTT